MNALASVNALCGAVNGSSFPSTHTISLTPSWWSASVDAAVSGIPQELHKTGHRNHTVCRLCCMHNALLRAIIAAHLTHLPVIKTRCRWPLRLFRKLSQRRVVFPAMHKFCPHVDPHTCANQRPRRSPAPPLPTPAPPHRHTHKRAHTHARATHATQATFSDRPRKKARRPPSQPEILLTNSLSHT